MAVPDLPDLIFNSLTGSGAVSFATFLALMITTGNTTTYDDGATVPVAARWVFSAKDTNKMVVAVPAATSPMAGKVVLIWAYETGVAPGASALLSPTVATASNMYFAAYWANAGATVAASDVTAAWSTNSANGPCNGTTGTFSGWMKFYAGTTLANVFILSSTDYLIVQAEEALGGIFTSWGGAGTRAPTDSTTDSETGLGGRVFDMGVSGTTAMPAGFITASGAGAMLGHAATAGYCQWAYRVPGQTTGSALTTMRGMSNRALNGSLTAFPLSDPLNCVCASGAVEPEPVVMRDIVGSGARDKVKVGRSRAFFYGPRARTKSILSSGGVKKYIACGQATATANDCLLLPYA